METSTILFVLTCYENGPINVQQVLFVDQSLCAHGSVMCRQCDNVKGPDDCHHFIAHCGHAEKCVTDVYQMSDGTHIFNYGCKHEAEACGHHAHPLDPIGKRGSEKRAHGTHVCQECCHSTGCDQHTCTKFIDKETTTAAPQTTTSDNGCRDYETETFRCAEFEKYNFCSDSTSVAYAIAHEKCAKHCGFCSTLGNVNPVTMASTTQRPVTVATTKQNPDIIITDSVDVTPGVVTVDVTPGVVTVDVASGNADCVDSGQQTLTCADIERYGFCSPDSGAGFSLANATCRKTCKLC